MKTMNREKKNRLPRALLFCGAALALCLLAACGRSAEPESAEKVRVPVLFEEDGKTLPEPPEEESGPDRAIPETASFQEAGRLFWNGAEVTLFKRDGDGTAFAKASALASAAGGELREDASGFTLEVGEESFFVSTLAGGFYRGKTRVGDPVTWKGELYLPASPLIEASALPRLDDGEDIYLTKAVKSADVPKGVRLPVLMYHAVSDDTWGINELFVKPAEMEKQLKYLVDHGYTTVTFEDLDRIDSIKKPVMLTFDDGYKDNYEELFPLLQKYNCKATVFMISGKLAKTHYLTEEMLREMADSGLVSIQSHTVSHPKLAEITGEKLRAELRDSRLEIARLTGRIPFVLCYPSGSYNGETRRVGAEYYSFGVRMNGGGYSTSMDPFLIPRYYVSRATSLSSFASMIG